MAVNRISLDELQALRAEMLKQRAKVSATKVVGSCSKSASKAIATRPSEISDQCETHQTRSNELTGQVQAHIEAFLVSAERYFSNERDIQVRLANWLQLQKDNQGNPFYGLVDTEYGVPLSALSEKLECIEFPKKQGSSWTVPESFPWHNNLSIDLVVCKDGRWVAIELKYATRRIDADGYVFGENIGKQGALANQATANLAMYAYWKDVRRLEVICKRFRNVAGGLAIMVSNNSDCWNKPNENSLYTDFSMHVENEMAHKVGGRVLRWKDGTSDTVSEGHPSFLLEGIYPCRWIDTGIKALTKSGKQFKYMITNISKL